MVAKVALPDKMHFLMVVVAEERTTERLAVRQGLEEEEAAAGPDAC